MYIDVYTFLIYRYTSSTHDYILFCCPCILVSNSFLNSHQKHDKWTSKVEPGFIKTQTGSASCLQLKSH